MKALAWFALGALAALGGVGLALECWYRRSPEYARKWSD